MWPGERLNFGLGCLGVGGGQKNEEKQEVFFHHSFTVPLRSPQLPSTPPKTSCIDMSSLAVLAASTLGANAGVCSTRCALSLLDTYR
jgi:hypothetical protein